MKPFRFLAAGGDIVDRATLVEGARRAEAIGYDAYVLPDHLVPQLAPLPALGIVAAATDRLRVGTFVLNNDLRHPAVLAHDLATLDLLTDGRLEIGIGAGWNVPEYESIALSFDPVATRVERLGESLAVLKGCFADGSFDFEGEHYTIHGLDLQPKPVQRPHPPIFLGGGGRRLLELAAREADIVGLAPRIKGGATDIDSVLAAGTAEKLAWIRAAAGDRFDSLEINTYPAVSRAMIVTDHVHAEVARLADRIRERSGRDITEDELLDSPHVFIGSVEALVEKIEGLRERFGITSIMAGEIEEFAPVVERLAGK